MEEAVDGRSEDADGDRPETSEARGRSVPLTSPKDRLCQKYLTPQNPLEISARIHGPRRVIGGTEMLLKEHSNPW